MSSVRSALSARACQIRAETKDRGCRPPVSVQVSGPLSAASPVVYKTASHLTAPGMALPLAQQFAVDVHLSLRRAASWCPYLQVRGELYSCGDGAGLVGLWSCLT